jgi:hypothetical protein
VAPTAFQWLNTPEKKLSEADLAELTRRMREQEENKRAEIERALKERKGLGGPTVNE